MSKFPYRWKLSDGYPAKGIEPHKLKVFGTFICGGGSSMGYKLAGYDHLGGVEIDPKIADVYKANHHPKHLFVEDIRAFLARKEYPEELYDLDLLDGSPPCSTFSVSGNREKDWGKKKKFAEGQALQTLDDLFFEYIALAKKLQPKTIIAENVKGLLLGNAKAYVNAIFKKFDEAGYKCQLFLLNAATMGVPQKRERVFFICHRKDLSYNPLKLSFSEKPILFKEIKNPLPEARCFDLINAVKIRLPYIQPNDRNLSDADFRYRGKKSFFNNAFAKNEKVLNTVTTQDLLLVVEEQRKLSHKEIILASTFPTDYNFKKVDPFFLLGMSVPPVMTAQIAHQIYLQWLSKTGTKQG